MSLRVLNIPLLNIPFESAPGRLYGASAVPDRALLQTAIEGCCGHQEGFIRMYWCQRSGHAAILRVATESLFV